MLDHLPQDRACQNYSPGNANSKIRSRSREAAYITKLPKAEHGGPGCGLRSLMTPSLLGAPAAPRFRPTIKARARAAQAAVFRSKRPVDRALSFCYGLGFDGSSAPYGKACVERDRPFPHVPPDALDDGIFDASIFHVVKNRSGVPRSSSCRQPLNECRHELPLCILARSAGLCSRMGWDGMRCDAMHQAFGAVSQ